MSQDRFLKGSFWRSKFYNVKELLNFINDVSV